MCEIQGHLKFALAGPGVTKNQHGEAVHRETPDDPEGIEVGEEGHIAAADDDGYDLQEYDDVDDAIAGAKTRMRLAEPVTEHAIFGNAIQDAIRTYDGGVHGAGKNQRANHYDESMKKQADENRAFQAHGQAAD